MRIIIESDGGLAPQVSLTSTATVTRDARQEVIDGGQPSAELLTALGAVSATQIIGTGEPKVERISTVQGGENAGSPPAWLRDAVESGRKRSLQ
jgi:hypothetical protein